jgi:hypothetical protein
MAVLRKEQFLKLLNLFICSIHPIILTSFHPHKNVCSTNCSLKINLLQHFVMSAAFCSNLPKNSTLILCPNNLPSTFLTNKKIHCNKTGSQYLFHTELLNYVDNSTCTNSPVFSGAAQNNPVIYQTSCMIHNFILFKRTSRFWIGQAT